ncbi:MAG: rod shape-determining protein, partial [Sphingomonadales bacterium]|nr:rod shape-determining protein [Sphingomonadales bacterium]
MSHGNSWRRADVAVDFGTSNIRVMRRSEGLVFDEPSLCCFEREAGSARLVAAGRLAQPMLDRT